MLNLEEIKGRILKGEEIEKILEKIDWKEFEELIRKILENHDFESFHNFRFRTKRKYEIDILANRDDLILAVDCKKWRRGRYKKTNLKYAVKSQKERVKKLISFLNKNFIWKNKLKISKRTKFIPLIVTWFEEDLIQYDNVFIVPVWKFNNFLLNLSEYI